MVSWIDLDRTKMAVRKKLNPLGRGSLASPTASAFSEENQEEVAEIDIELGINQSNSESESARPSSVARNTSTDNCIIS